MSSPCPASGRGFLWGTPPNPRSDDALGGSRTMTTIDVGQTVVETGKVGARAGTGSSTVVETNGLAKRYGEAVAVAELDFRLQAGEVFGLLGPNGAGKTTTIL